MIAGPSSKFKIDINHGHSVSEVLFPFNLKFNTMPSYSSAKSLPNRAQDHHETTVARLAQIQSQLAEGPRGGKLNGKVCIITGVGSLKGIG